MADLPPAPDLDAMLSEDDREWRDAIGRAKELARRGDPIGADFLMAKWLSPREQGAV